jgi:uncharacterized protein (DUF433 family)
MILETSMAGKSDLLTASEAASITGVPLRQVHRIIDAGLLKGAVKKDRNERLLPPKTLVGLRLAFEMSDVLTLASRRAIVAKLIRRPQEQLIVHADVIRVDTRPAARTVREGLAQLAKARRLVTATKGVQGGAPVFKGTDIAVHDIAEMLDGGLTPAAIVKAHPPLDRDGIRLGALYATAYPRRGRPRKATPAGDAGADAAVSESAAATAPEAAN